ncbi:MAG TPA: ABC transporter permease subunit [Chloroflexi bacterium]|jgi:ABC-2 type transport system permease protein|nr:ABC transporter permease subunit [Chloroflexota bacterium]
MLRFLAKELRARRGMMIGWGLGMMMWSIGVILLFPSVGPQFGRLDLPEFYEFFGLLSSFSTLEGWIAVETLDLGLGIVLAVVAVIVGGDMLAGEEERGTLELLLALPVRRWQLVLAKIIALGFAFFIILFATFVGNMLGVELIRNQVEVDVTTRDILVAAMMGWPLLMVFATMAMWLGAYLPARAQAVGVASGVLIISYLVNGIGALSDRVEALVSYMPHNYYSAYDLLTEGMQIGHLFLLLGLTALFIVLTLLSFERRDVTVMAWPWRRARPESGRG